MEWTNEKGHNWCEIVDIDTYVGRVLQPDIRPAKWSGEDIRRAMGEFTPENRRDSNQRRGVILVNNDVGTTVGASPSVSIQFQPMLPGEKLDFHRHTYLAIYYWVEGEGYTVVDDDNIDRPEHRTYWKAGDVTSAPAWANHAHVVTSDTPVLQLAVHDFPDLCAKRVMMSEDPDGHENLRHMVKGVVPSFSNNDTWEDLEKRSQPISITTKIA